MKIPLAPFAYRTLGDVANYFSQITTAIAAGWNIEHLEDGRHNIPWIDSREEFNAADFRAVSGAWTVVKSNVLSYKHARLGPLTFINFNVQSSTLSGVLGNELRIRIPGRHRMREDEGGFTGSGWISVDGGGNNGVLHVFTRGGAIADQLGLFKTDLSNWIASAGDVGIRGTIILDTESY